MQTSLQVNMYFMEFIQGLGYSLHKQTTIQEPVINIVVMYSTVYVIPSLFYIVC